MTVTRAYAIEHFEELCDRAERGEEIVVDHPGHPGLTLVPQPDPSHLSPREAVEAIRAAMRGRPPLEGVTIRELIDEGRRF